MYLGFNAPKNHSDGPGLFGLMFIIAIIFILSNVMQHGCK